MDDAGNGLRGARATPSPKLFELLRESYGLDGSDEAQERLGRVLTTDPGTGVMRHADAGYTEAVETAREHGIKIPMLDASS